MKRLRVLVPFLFCILFTQTLSADIKTVRIYSGPGAAEGSFKLVKRMFQRHTPHANIHFFVDFSSLVEILRHEEEASLLVMPGGSTLVYESQLSKLSDEDSQFLLRALGGRGPAPLSYLGIGAGAYFAGLAYQISFCMENGENIEICSTGMNRLSLFLSMSTAFKNYNPENFQGAQFPYITLPTTGEKGTVLWNGGPAFGSSYRYSNSILASYDNNNFAIIGRQTDTNSAVISGIHFEFDPYDPENNFNIKDFPTPLHDSIRNGGIAKETQIAVLKYLGFEI